MLSREKLIEMVKKLANAEYSEKDGDEAINVLKRETGDKLISDYIFWADPELSPEDVVDLALGLRDIEYRRFEP